MEAPPISRAAADGGVGYGQLLRQNREVRRLWLAEIISYLGDWFDSIALYTALLQLTGATSAIGVAFAAKTLPVFAVSPIAGPLCDRFDRKKLMIAADLARALLACLLVVGYRAGSSAALIAVVVAMVSFSGVFIPAKQAVIPVLARPAELGAANALSMGTWSVMLALGAAAGGLFTGAFGIEASFVCDGASFLASAVLLARLPALRPLTTAELGRGAAPAGSFREGLAYLWDRPHLAGILSLKPLMSLSSAAIAMAPVFAERLLSRGHEVAAGALATGALLSARGLGALVGTVGGRHLARDRPERMQRMIVPLLALCAAGYLGLWQARSLGAAACAYFVAATGSATIWLFSSVLAQLASDDAFRGRVFAVEFGLATLSMSAAGAGGGALVDAAGWPVSSIAGLSAALLLAPAAVWLGVLALAPARVAPSTTRPST